MTCHDCNNELRKVTIDRYQYVESGLDSIFIRNLPGWYCATCNFTMPEFHAAGLLHESIATRLVAKPTRLTRDEFTLLRKVACMLTEQAAQFRLMKVSSAMTEAMKPNQPRTLPLERVLRTWVLLLLPQSHKPPELLCWVSETIFTINQLPEADDDKPLLIELENAQWTAAAV